MKVYSLNEREGGRNGLKGEVKEEGEGGRENDVRG